MQLSDLENAVSYWLDDLNFGYFTKTQIDLWLNNAQREVQKRLLKAGQNYYTLTLQTTLVVNQREYVLPLDVKKIHRLDIVISGIIPNESVQPLTPMTFNQSDLVTNGASTPKAYSIKRNRIMIWPAPDTALTMRLTYTPLVTDMTLASDVPNVPIDYHELIALLAAQDGFIKDTRVPELMVAKIAAYQKDMDIDAQERRQDMSREVRETGELGGADGMFF